MRENEVETSIDAAKQVKECEQMQGQRLCTCVPEKPPISSDDFTILWQGTSGAKGFRLSACMYDLSLKSSQVMAVQAWVGFLS